MRKAAQGPWGGTGTVAPAPDSSPGLCTPSFPPWTLTKDRVVSNAACDLHRIGAARDQAGTPSHFSLWPGRQAWGKPGASPAPRGPQRLPDRDQCRPVLQLRLPAPPTDPGCRMHGMQLCPGHPHSPNRRAEGRGTVLGAPRKAQKSCTRGLGEEAGRVGPRGPEVSEGKRQKLAAGQVSPKGLRPLGALPSPACPSRGSRAVSRANLPPAPQPPRL